MTKENKPEIRFSGFSDAWKQRKVKELCSISTGKSNTQDKVDDGEYPFYVRSPIVERSKKYLYDEEAVLTVGDGVGTGKVFHYVNGKYDLHQRCYRMFNFSEELNAKYFYHIFSKMFYKRVMSMTAKTSVDSVRMDMIADMEIPVPNIKEQEKIGAFFSDIDNLITLQLRKLELLKNQKKAFLEKMFPKEGENVPEIRFSGFSDAWKQRKFGDVLVSIQTGTNKLGSDRNSGQPLLKMGNLQSGYFDLSKLEFLENKAEPENIVKQGDFFFNTRNTLELVGKGATWFGESNKYAFNSNIARFTLKDINTGFFNYLYNTNYVKKQIRARAMGTTSVAAIYPRSLKSVDIVIPNMEEQIKLSNLFMNLDSTITLQLRKLEILKNIKKSFLQKMFV